MNRFLVVLILGCISCTTNDLPWEEDSNVDAGGIIIELEPDTSVKLEEFTQCDVHCKTNDDCLQWNGICTIVYDGHQIRSLCSADCNKSKTCEENGFSCIPLYKGDVTHFNWQCLPVNRPICQGDS